jgi:hypothetical protein
VPEWVQRLGARLTVPTGKRVAGLAATGENAELTKEPIVNGSDGQVVDNARTLRTDVFPYNHRGNIGLSHVEGHVAAIIRERVREASQQSMHVSLVITREPCEGVLGCRKLLRDLIPTGSSITVYVKRDGEPPKWFGTFDGNGKATRK